MQVSSSIPGTSLTEMLGVGRRISAEVLALPSAAKLANDGAERPRRDERPDALEQQEAELGVGGGQDGQQGRADQVEREVHARLGVEHAELGGGERDEDV